MQQSHPGTLEMYLLLMKMASETISRYIDVNTPPAPVMDVSIGDGTAVFAGDTHGAIDVTAEILMRKGGADLICFLGDLVDRGEHQLYNLLYLLESSLLNRRIVIVRGNHESPLLNDFYGFKGELAELGAEELYGQITAFYGKLPYACLVNGKILGVHGGIPEQCDDLVQWRKIPMNDSEPSDPCGFGILWNDPDEEGKEYRQNPRGGGSLLYGENAFMDFMSRNGLSLLVRGHQVQMEGIREMFGGMLCSVFSSRYHGGKAAILVLSNQGRERRVELIPEASDSRMFS